MAYCVVLARLLEVRVDVLHVVPGMGPIRILVYGSEGASREPFREGSDALRKMATEAGVETRFLVGRGPLPGPVILEEAKSEGANLIVLGARGVGDAQPNQLGSVSTDIVRRSTCPVLIIPPHVREATVDEKLDRIVTVVSYAHLIEPMIVVAADLAGLLGSRLDVLVQIEGPTQMHRPERGTRKRGSLAIPSNRSGRRAHHRCRRTISIHVLGRSTSEDVLDFARESESDMLLLEAPGLASMNSPFEQEVEEIVGRAPCPVMLINTRGRAVSRQDDAVEEAAAEPVGAL